MPDSSVRLLRLSLLALLAGGICGAVLLGGEPWASPWLSRVRTAHVQLMLFGWLVPFVLATAYWILPRHAQGESRGSERTARIGARLLQTGVVLGPAAQLAGLAGFAWLGAVAAVAGAAVFLGLLWPRVKAFGSGREPIGRG